jgi:deoxyribodipyrimidine photo-lyase
VGSPDIQVVWFKRDLRTRDHQPLVLAAERGPVLPLYIVEPDLWRLPDMAAQHWEFIRASLLELRGALADLGAPLVVRTGEAVQVLETLRIELDDRIQTIWAHEETGNGWTYARDRDVLRWARTHRVQVNEMPRDGIVRRLKDRDDWGKLAGAQFAGALLQPPVLREVRPVIEPGHIPNLADLQLAPTPPSGTHEAGQRAARATLDSFLQTRCIGYEKRLSSPVTAWDGCSRLSAHLTYGTISLREVMARTQRVGSQEQTKRFSLKAFHERLHWRSHFVQKLEDQPSLEHQSYIAAFDEIRLDPATTDVGAQRFHAWSTGHTGYPMVDACMRSLNETGWTNFRMRALLVSFASYDLWLDWRWTARHLAQAFIDYEPGIHYPQVQMQSGTTGINSIRIYDPTKQGLDHDPTGAFVRRWVPELAGVPDASIHQPWLLGDTLFGGGANYVSPVVNHSDAVAYAWNQIDRIKVAARRNGTAAAIQEQHGSRRPAPSNRRGPRRAP